MLNHEILDSNVVYEVRYGKKGSNEWCSRNFYFTALEATKQYDNLKDDWDVELIKYVLEKSFAEKNFTGEFKNITDNMFPNRYVLKTPDFIKCKK